MSRSGQSPIVAIQGELGSNSHVAARHYFDPDSPTIEPCRSFTDLFASMHRGDASFAMAPVDNSLAGTIFEVWDLLCDTDNPPDVHGEILLRIRHCLIGHPGSQLAEIERVYSHPQALAQCRRFLASLDGSVAEEEYDTAGAVEIIAGRNTPAEAAIAPAEAARSHGMEILATDIQDRHDNFTRFLVVGCSFPALEQSDLKTSLVVKVQGAEQALPDILELFDQRDIEVLRSDSRQRESGDLCYVDISGGTAAPAVSEALAEVRQRSLRLCIVGPYPKGDRAEPVPPE